MGIRETVIVTGEATQGTAEDVISAHVVELLRLVRTALPSIEGPRDQGTSPYRVRCQCMRKYRKLKRCIGGPCVSPRDFPVSGSR